MKALHFQFGKQIGVMIITLINIQTSIKLYSKSFSNCLMKHFHTGIHWDIKKWGWYNQQRLESIQYWIMRLWIILILLICFLPAYLLQFIELIRLFAFLLKIMNSQLNLQSFCTKDDILRRNRMNEFSVMLFCTSAQRCVLKVSFLVDSLMPS